MPSLSGRQGDALDGNAPAQRASGVARDELTLVEVVADA